MELLELEEMTGIPSPPITHISPFNQIIQRDDSEDHRQAARELAYIHFYVHHDSPYATWDEDIRSEKIIKDIWGDGEYTPDDVVKEGIEKYKELTSNEYIRLLASARKAANKLIDHFDNMVIEDPKDAKDAIANISKIGDVVEGIDKLKEQIEKHESKKNTNRAGVKTNKYSE